MFPFAIHFDTVHPRSGQARGLARRWFPILAGGSILAAMLSSGGCAATVYVVATQVPPTLIVTPLSSPLPTVATQVPIGATGSPYHMLIVSNKPDLNTSALASDLTAQTGQAFTIDLVPSNAEALRQVCTTPSLAWLDSAGVLAAIGQNCGSLAIKIEQNSGSTPQAGLTVDVIGRSVTGASINVLGDLKGKVFCRLNDSDLTSWIIPALMLRSEKLDPALDLAAVHDYPDAHSLMQALASGSCNATGIASGTLNTSGLTIPNGVRLNVVKTSPAAPFGGLVIANGVPASLATRVTTLLATDPDPLRALVPADHLAPAKSSDFADFAKLMQSAGVDYTVLSH